MKRLSFLFACALPLLAAGCGGDDTASTPSAKCQALISAVCGKFVFCGVESSMSSCVAEFAKELDCSRAVSVSASYDTCMSEVNGASCDVVKASDELPPSCSKTIAIK